MLVSLFAASLDVTVRRSDEAGVVCELELPIHESDVLDADHGPWAIESGGKVLAQRFAEFFPTQAAAT
jgi:hypothetical protein